MYGWGEGDRIGGEADKKAAFEERIKQEGAEA